nr:catalase [Bradyrhizobium sp. NBAIM08]
MMASVRSQSGGVKQSGFGVEFGVQRLREFTTVRQCFSDLVRTLSRDRSEVKSCMPCNRRSPYSALNNEDFPMLSSLRIVAVVSTIVVVPGVAVAESSLSAASRQRSNPEQLVDALNGVFGKHPRARAVHAKGLVLQGSFMPGKMAQSVSKAPHFEHEAVPITARFSNFAGLPNISDNDGLARLHGFAIKFRLPDGSETDIVAHSFNGFPSPTVDDFRELLIRFERSAGVEADTPRHLSG